MAGNLMWRHVDRHSVVTHRHTSMRSSAVWSAITTLAFAAASVHAQITQYTLFHRIVDDQGASPWKLRGLVTLPAKAGEKGHYEVIDSSLSFPNSDSGIYQVKAIPEDVRDSKLLDTWSSTFNGLVSYVPLVCTEAT